MPSTRVALVAGLTALAGASIALGQVVSGWSRIGVAASVRGLVKAALPGAAGRVISTGKPLFAGDRVTTGPDARLQVLLADESSFLIGPNSEMVLDDFVYDPGHSAGRMAAKFVRGVFRFISGKISAKDPDKVKIALPLGTIGVRGTVVLGRIGPDGSATVVLGGPGVDNDGDARAGRIVVTGSGRSVELWRPGFGTELGKAGPGPERSMPEELGNIMRDIAPRPAAGEKGQGRAASKASREETAMARETLAALRGSDSSRMLRDKDSLQAIQDLALSSDGPSTWQQLQQALQGTAFYSGIGTYYCSGSCPGGNSNSMNLSMKVDFDAKTYGGGSSALNMVGFPLADTTVINPTSYSGLSGPAIITFNKAGGNTNNSKFDGTTVTFQNRGGIAAQASVNLQYDNQNTLSSATASGSFTAHR